MSSIKDPYKYLEKLTQEKDFDKQKFKRFIAKDCLKLLSKEDQELKSLIRKWLKDPTFEYKFNAIADAAPPNWKIYYIAVAITYEAPLTAWTAAIAFSYPAKNFNTTKQNKFSEYVRYAKSLLFKPNLPQSFISYILNCKTEEELNIWLIDYTQEKNLPDIREYISFLYEKEYSSDLIINNKELKHLL